MLMGDDKRALASMRHNRATAVNLLSAVVRRKRLWMDRSEDGAGRLRVQTANGLLTGLLTNCPRPGGTERDGEGQRRKKSRTIKGFEGLEQTEEDGR